MWSDFEAYRYLTYEPRFIDPEEPSGFWLCDNPGDVMTVQINAGCLAAGATLEDLPRCTDFFRQFPFVLIVCADPHRRETMTAQVRRLLPDTVLLVAEDQAFRGFSTIQELKANCGLKAVNQILLYTRELPACGLLDLADVVMPDIQAMPRVTSGISNLDRAIGGFYLGEVSVWTGKRGEGKSTLLSQLLLEAVDQGHGVCAYSGELPAWKFKYWTLLQAAGPRYLLSHTDRTTGKEMREVTPTVRKAIEDWLRGRFLLYDIGGNTVHDAADILRVFAYAARRYDAKVFLVDNIMTARLKTGSDRDYYRSQSEFMAQLSAFAKRHQVHVHLVAHPRKTGDKLTNDDVSGTSDITNYADNVFTLEREEEEDAQQDTVLTVLKNRFFGERGRSIGLNFETTSRRFYKSGTGQPDRTYGWEFAFSGRQITMEDSGAPEQDPFGGSTS